MKLLVVTKFLKEIQLYQGFRPLWNESWAR